MKSKKNGTPWSKSEVKRTRRLAAEGRSSKEAAAVLGRTRGAVAYKAMVMGIRFRSIKQPRGVQKRLAARRRRRSR